MANEVQKKEFSTTVSQWTKEITNLVTRDFKACEVTFDEYSKSCAMAAMQSIYQLVTASAIPMNQMDMSNLREIVGQCASLKLNANAVPRECYFQMRKKKIGNSYVNVVEMGIEGDGNDAILRNFGVNVETVYPCWIVKEGDDFAYPKHKGMHLEPPEWTQNGRSQRTIRVVYPVALKGGTEQYLIAERESVKSNLFAHVRNNLMNETFGICESRFKATAQQKAQIEERKNVIYDALRNCETVDEMLACEKARPYISAAWLDTPEAMIIRKMRNNAIKKYTKDFNAMAKQSFVATDETYIEARDEIAENANSVEFKEVEIVSEQATEPKPMPEFMTQESEE